MWALVLNNKVVEVTGIDPSDRFHPSLNFIACPEGVEPGFLYDNGNFYLPKLTNSELLQLELEQISSLYQLDIDNLNQAYLAAVVSDGPGEPAKQQAVRDAITARKAQYAADKEAARLKYPI